MNDQQRKHRLSLVAGVGLATVALAIVVATLANRVERERQIGEMQAVVERGIAQFRAEQYELSLETLGSIPEHLVVDWHIPYYQGSALVQLKEYRKGADFLENALALNPNEENVLFALGVVYFKLGNLALSKAYFASVLEIDPDHEDAKGMTLQLELMPVGDGRIVLREPVAETEDNGEGA